MRVYRVHAHISQGSHNFANDRGRRQFPWHQWKKSDKEGKLMDVELLDAQGGQIRMTFFSEAVDQFADVMEEKKVNFECF